MSTFADREKDFENKFKHDQELQFKVTARRNRLFGDWAAGEMGLAGDAMNAYAKDVVLEKVQGDLKAAGIELDNPRLRKKMDELLVEAKTQVMSE
jgi:hypothetical protein